MESQAIKEDIFKERSACDTFYPFKSIRLNSYFFVYILLPRFMFILDLYFIEFISGHKVKQLEQDLEELVHKKCEQSDTIITLPIEALMKFNVTSLSLNEPSCMGIKNETLGVWVRFVCKN